MSQHFTVIIEKDSKGWFVSEVVELPGCHTQAKSLDQLMERTKEAIQAYLDIGEEPEINAAFVGIQQIKVWNISRLPTLTGKELGKIITRLGFAYSHTRGSHVVYKHADGRRVTVPVHAGEEIGPGLLTKIIKKDLLMTREEFEMLLR